MVTCNIALTNVGQNDTEKGERMGIKGIYIRHSKKVKS